MGLRLDFGPPGRPGFSEPQIQITRGRARAHTIESTIIRFSVSHVSTVHHGHVPHVLPWCWSGNGDYGLAGYTLPILLARDEACPGTTTQSVVVEIAHMGLAESSAAGLPETGEAFEQWCGRHGSGANGMGAVPAPADWKLKTRYTTLICGHEVRDRCISLGKTRLVNDRLPIWAWYASLCTKDGRSRLAWSQIYTAFCERQTAMPTPCAPLGVCMPAGR